MALVYVDGVLFFGTSDKLIDYVIGDLKKNFDLSEEGTVEAFLGVEISDHNKGKLARQTFLIQRVIQAIGMGDFNLTKTPSTTIALGADYRNITAVFIFCNIFVAIINTIYHCISTMFHSRLST